MTVPASGPLPPDIAAALNAAVSRIVAFRVDLRWYASVTSTMDVASEAAHLGGPEGLTIVADEQTRGRGRRGRVWSSPPGAGLYVSFVLRPPLESLESPVLPLLTLAAGVAVRDALTEATGLAPVLKWPNDVMIGRRKLAGILAEGIAIGTPAQAVVLGIGINLAPAAHPPEIADRATSIEVAVGEPPDRSRLLEELLVAVAEAYDRLRRGSADDILRAWRAAAPSADGTEVEWDGADGLRVGVTAGVDDDGALRVVTAQGLERITAGEVRWR